jgi:hypothetical protein
MSTKTRQLQNEKKRRRFMITCIVYMKKLQSFPRRLFMVSLSLNIISSTRRVFHSLDRVQTQEGKRRRGKHKKMQENARKCKKKRKEEKKRRREEEKKRRRKNKCRGRKRLIICISIIIVLIIKS